jgi:hypothetical protein
MRLMESDMQVDFGRLAAWQVGSCNLHHLR